MSSESQLSMPDWTYLMGKPKVQAIFKQAPEDFCVTEMMGFQPKGEGEHLWLRVRKEGVNTADLCQKLASAFAVHRNAVGYAGLKDKHSVSEQWLSVQLPGKNIEHPEAYLPEGIELLEFARHDKKLRPGSNSGNYFLITLHRLMAERCVRDDIERRLNQIQQTGVPNYFGEQRFGFGGNNIRLAQKLFSGRKLSRNRRSMALSAARSFLFNQVLSVRVKQGLFNRALGGEALILSGSNSFFSEPVINEELQERIQNGDIQLSGPLWGKGGLPSLSEANTLEIDALQGMEEYMTGLEKAGLRQERRALSLHPQGLQWKWLDSGPLQLRFSLPKGCFATAVLREVVNYSMPQVGQVPEPAPLR